MTGDTIKITPPNPITHKPVVGDGQHRLTAIAQGDKAVLYGVAFGVPPELRPFFDQVRGRTSVDVLGFEHFEHASLLSAAARCVWFFERRSLEFSQATANDEILDLVRRHPKLLDWVKEISGPSAPPPLKLGVIVAACYWISLSTDLERSVEYLDSFIGGENLKKGDPALTVRDRILSDTKFRHAGSNARARLAAVMFRAWDCHLRNQPILQIKIVSVSSRNACWPKGCPYLVGGAK